MKSEIEKQTTQIQTNKQETKMKKSKLTGKMILNCKLQMNIRSIRRNECFKTNQIRNEASTNE